MIGLDHNDEYNEIILKMNIYVRNKLCMKMTMIELLETIINNFKSDHCDDSKEILKRKNNKS